MAGRAPAPPAMKLARGANDEEHAMSQNLNDAVAVHSLMVLTTLDSDRALLLVEYLSFARTILS
jgi:hypothetical protein